MILFFFRGVSAEASSRALASESSSTRSFSFLPAVMAAISVRIWALERAFLDDLFDMYMCARNARGNIEVSACYNSPVVAVAQIAVRTGESPPLPRGACRGAGS